MRTHSGWKSWLVVLVLCQLFVSPTSLAAEFARGADVGWLSQMESSGEKFQNKDGVQQDCLQILKSLGMDSIRFRVWVSPAHGWCGQADVVAMARRASAMGFRIMIDFHYSDSWADPGKQTKPAAWAGHSVAQLEADIAQHTTAVLNALKAAGVTPEWIQIGNETNNGMLWGEGRASDSMANFTRLVNAGNDAMKAVFPRAKTIVHLSNGYDSGLFRWMFDGLKANGARFDVIGMSLYPEPGDWPELNRRCLDNMNDMVARYGKEVMICEVGMTDTADSACRDFVTDIIAKAKSVKGKPGLGVFYWEPECHGWNGYHKGAFDFRGRPTKALEAFAHQ